MATSRTTSVITDITDLPSIFFEEPEPVEDGMQQEPVINEVIYLIRDHFRDDTSVFVCGGGFIFYDPADGNRRVAPDLYIVFDVDAEGIRGEGLSNYLMWRTGKQPDFVMEVASPSTADNDLGRKRNLYADLGVREYWRLDPTGGELYGQPLEGERLVDGEYRPYELHTADDGTIWSYSEVLDLRIHWGPDLRESFDVRDSTGRTINPAVIEREARAAAEIRESHERETREAAEEARAAAEIRESHERETREAAEEARAAAEVRESRERETREAAEEAREAAEEARLAAEARERGEREARLAAREAAEARERELLAEIERLRRRHPDAKA